MAQTREARLPSARAVATPRQLHWGMRVASSPGDGAGHFMRCLALADTLSGCEDQVTMFLGPEPGALAAIAAAHGHRVRVLRSEELDELGSALRDAQPDGLVIDGYRFDEAVQRHLHSQVPVRLAIDDLMQPCRIAEIVLNQNLGPRASDYRGLVRSDARLLLGPRYALLRQEFRGRSRRTVRAGARCVLVTMGAEDAQNATSLALRALEAIAEVPLEVRVLIGPRFRQPALVEQQCLGSRHRCEMIHAPDRMDRLMAWADVAVLACGSTVWECLASGLPIVAFPVADNQRPVARELQRRKLAVVLEGIGTLTDVVLARAIETLLRDKPGRQRLSRAGQQIVDGRGAMRVAELLRARVGRALAQSACGGG